MKKSPTDTYVDIELFRNDLKDIDWNFIENIVSIYKISICKRKINCLLMTNDATYAYGKEICKWLSLKHNPKQPQKIDNLNGKKIIQVDSSDELVVVLTVDGLVYLASEDSEWQTNNTFRLISTDNDRFEMIACGRLHLLLLRQDGTVFAMGDNFYWQLANIFDSSYDTLVNIGLKNVKTIACGLVHNLALTNTNQIYSWGCNENAQLGLGAVDFARETPTLVSFPGGPFISPIKNIAAGMHHSLFLFEDGQIFRCGYDECYIDDDDQNTMVPKKLPIENVLNVACKNDLEISLVLDQSSNYYVLNDLDDENEELKKKELVQLKKLDGQPNSFVAASLIAIRSPITFGLTSAIYTFETNDPISFIRLLDNLDNYDVEFIIGDKRILACKCYLRMVSNYYNRMFSGQWQENKQVMINSYSYDAYYSYLIMLHTGHIRINQLNIAELIDLANCYGDEKLMENCKTFIQRDLNERTLLDYFPLINKYQLDTMHDKLVELTVENILPKIADNLLENKENIMKFLELNLNEQPFFFLKK